MWSSESGAGRRRLLGLVVALTAVAGCGLRPLHGGAQGEALDGRLAAIEVRAPNDRVGYVVRRELLDALNPRGLAVPGEYDLVVRLQRSLSPLIIQLNDDTTRFDLVLAAFYELRRKSDGKVVYRSAARRAASYNQRQSPFATRISQRNAEDRAARELALFIRTQLALHLDGAPA